jgi:hypothetical protein
VDDTSDTRAGLEVRAVLLLAAGDGDHRAGEVAAEDAVGGRAGRDVLPVGGVLYERAGSGASEREAGGTDLSRLQERGERKDTVSDALSATRARPTCET